MKKIIKKIIEIFFVKKPIKKQYILNKHEAEVFADVFHKTYQPDIDGLIGMYFLSDEVMKIYIKKYSKERGWI